MDNQEKIEKLIKDNLYMTISVATLDGNPWIANLYYAFDSKYNFYWYSSKNTKHSNLIADNPKIVVSIFNSTATGDDVDAVYIEAQAHEVTNRGELLKGLSAYGKKMLKTGFVDGKKKMEQFVNSEKDFQGKSVLRMYKAIPTKIWKLAPSDVYNNKYIDSRIEVRLID